MLSYEIMLISNSTLLQNHFNTARARGSHELSRRSEEDEDLLDVTFNVLDLLTDDVEADGLGEGSALTDGNDITSADAESGGAVSGDGLMALLESVVLLDVVEVVTTDDDGVLHLVGDNHTPINELVICRTGACLFNLTLLLIINK